MGEVSNEFLERRKGQLARDGREDLVRSLQREQSTGLRVLSGGKKEALSSRPSVDVLQGVRLLLARVFSGESGRKQVEQRVSHMTSSACMEALRCASPQDVNDNPVYYSVLFERMRIEHEQRALRLRDRILQVKSTLHFHPEQRISPYDRRRVADLSLEDLENLLLHASVQSLRDRSGFYWALLERLEREF